MKPAYECSLDPAKMPSRQGKKFCENCQKRVHDLRRKSDEKIALFYKVNPTACVIAYEDQLEKLPAVASEHPSRNYLPYAASVIAIALLPALTVAQDTVRPENQAATIMPMVIPDMQVPVIASTAESSTKNFTKYYIKGKVKLRDKKFRTKAGRNITIFITKYSPEGKFIRQDTLISGKLSLAGTFRLKSSKEQIEELQAHSGTVHIRISNLGRAQLEDIKFDGNATLLIQVSARVRFVGRF